MAEPVPNHRHVDPCRDKAYRRGMPKLVRGYSLPAREGIFWPQPPRIAST